MSFENQRKEIIAICKSLLDEGRVNLVLGFAGGQPEGNSIPFFIRKKDEVDNLKWDDTCTPNLAKYLTEKKEGVAIVAKPCDARALVMYMVENQIDRNKIYIIGVECAGMKNRDGSPAPGCEKCNVRTPTVYDILIKSDDACIPSVDKLGNNNEENTYMHRLARFQNEIKKCILCYSCRQACYGCYCETCFMDRNMPNWLPSELDSGSKMVFHLGRAMHLAGRCVECGACERACPSGVKIRYLAEELADFCKELYGYQPGINPDEIPAMTAFNQNDKEVGFLGGEDNDSCCGSKG